MIWSVMIPIKYWADKWYTGNNLLKSNFDITCTCDNKNKSNGCTFFRCSCFAAMNEI